MFATYIVCFECEKHVALAEETSYIVAPENTQ